MLGLRRRRVRLAPYCECWADAFTDEHARLVECLGSYAREIEHVGSTAIPGMIAKPILDIGVLTPSGIGLEEFKQPLSVLGYIDRGDKGSDGGYLFVRESAPDVRTHHLHVIDAGDPAWENYIRFRDLMTSNPSLRSEYAALKRDLAKKFAGDRQRYTNAKSSFMTRMLGMSEA